MSCLYLEDATKNYEIFLNLWKHSVGQKMLIHNFLQEVRPRALRAPNGASVQVGVSVSVRALREPGDTVKINFE